MRSRVILDKLVRREIGLTEKPLPGGGQLAEVIDLEEYRKRTQ
jgi:hypothetical protein